MFFYVSFFFIVGAGEWLSTTCRSHGQSSFLLGWVDLILLARLMVSTHPLICQEALNPPVKKQTTTMFFQTTKHSIKQQTTQFTEFTVTLGHFSTSKCSNFPRLRRGQTRDRAFRIRTAFMRRCREPLITWVAVLEIGAVTLNQNGLVQLNQCSRDPVALAHWLWA